MSNRERIKLVAFTAITALASLLIIIIGAHSLFQELFFYSIVITLMAVIVVLVVYAFFWERTARYVRDRLWRRKMDSLAREYFDDFRDFVNRFTSLSEFRAASQGIMGVIGGLLKKATSVQGVLIDRRLKNFNSTLQYPLNDLKQRLDDLHWKKSEINYEFLLCLVKEFENYVRFHKQLYVDFAVGMAREVGNVPEATKRSYSDYKDDYNQFIIAYTEFAKRTTKTKLRIFDDHLEKACEL